MIRTRRAPPLLLLSCVLLLAGCGTEWADTGAGAPSVSAVASSAPGAESSASGATPSAPGAASAPSGDAGLSTPTPSTAAPGRAELESRIRALGIAPELVRVTHAPGFTPAQQSVGANGDDGFSVAYRAEDGAVPHRYADRPAFAGHHAHQVTRGDCVVWLSGEHVSDGILRAALAAVHRPSTAEPAALLPSSAPAAVPTGPVRRGDLPAQGDGEPDNRVRVRG